MKSRLYPFFALVLASCAVGPDYRRPAAIADAATPAAFKEGSEQAQGNWKQAQPKDDISRGKWWRIFGDPVHDSLQEQVDISNQTLVRAEAQYRQAEALVQAARSSFFPSLNTNVTSTRSRASSTTISQPSTVPVSRGVVTNYGLPATVAWEADVWGHIRRTVEVNRANAQASVADLEAVRLLAHAALAQNYFQLRALDSQKQLYDETIAAYEKSLKLTQNQYSVGVAAKADVVQAQAQLKSVQAQSIDLDVARAQLEHAIASLIGKAASNFSIPRAPLAITPPAVPTGLPSELLERRPDIAGAERRMAAANAQIGVAKSAFYPVFTLNASGGFQSSNYGQWVTTPSRFWAIGPSIALSLFDGGLRRAQTNQAIAAYDASVATYRLAVLTGFQEVEDNLAALRVLEQEALVQTEAAILAEQSLALTFNQYKAGTVTYLAVTVVAAAALNSQRTSVDILSRRMVASVLLIKALGGGWNASELPSADALTRDTYTPVKATSSPATPAAKH